jgi:hydrogenase maturation protein HypF
MAIYSQPEVLRKQISVKGIVQGVGFRPFVYKIASRLGLYGCVFNTSSGVIIDIEGPQQSIDEFLDRLRSSPPPLAQVNEITTTEMAPCGCTDFVIRPSVAARREFVLVSPDVGTCSDCWDDFGEARNRRFGYPFTNCTNCGPRYTIIRDTPYDRPATTMSSFRMCEACQKEYDDSGNRRFHAQPNACPACGPSLLLVKSGSSAWDSDARSSFGDSSIELLRDVRQLLRSGKIIAVKGLGGFLLACDARNDDAVRLLRKRKKRSDKPFALMSRDIASVESLCRLDDDDRISLLSPQRPIVILQGRSDAEISPAVAPGNNTLGVMLPYTPLHYLLFSDSPRDASEFSALVMTSGNINEEPIVIANEEAWKRLQAVADYFLFHDRDIHMRTDDSVTRRFRGKERVLRRSRGYVPCPIDLGIPVREILACGGELKNTFCLTKDCFAIMSQHIGDLENYETWIFFEETLANLKKLFRVEPMAVAYDLHPRFITHRFAKELPLGSKIGVQHHHAHIVSCMAENHLQGKVIGVAFDGTGYGTDGQIWGGEFLIADFAGFERRAHLRYIPLPGGDAAVRQPWRAALSCLRETFGEQIPERAFASLVVPEKERAIVEQMLVKRINTVQTSSCGRLFDAVASLIGVRQKVNFEGQAAIELESLALSDVQEHYSFEISQDHVAQIDMRSMIAEVVQDLASKSQGYISARFHNTLVKAIVDVCRLLHNEERLNRVCLSGGSFQNMYLLAHTVASLERHGFEVYLHSMVPPNDGGIALGQAVIANAVLGRES